MNDTESRPENPVAASVQKLRHELDRWMETAMTQGGKALGALGLRGQQPWRPAVDVVELPESVLVAVNLSGADPAKVDVSIAGNMLTVKGEAPETTTADDATYHVRQRNHGSFERSIPLPAPVDPDQVIAEARHGVLTIRLSKAERAKSRQIHVRQERSEP